METTWSARRASCFALVVFGVQGAAFAGEPWESSPPPRVTYLSYDADSSELSPVLITGLNEAPEPVALPNDAGTADATTSAACNCPACGAAQKKPSPGCKTCCHGHLIDWSKFPETIRPMPRPGIFPITPSGPGYYSACDHLTGTCRKAAPKSGYAPFAINAWPFFDADWRYLESVPFNDRSTVEKFKRIHLNDCWMLSLGGEFWARYHDENNSRLLNVDNDFTLAHVRQYADLWYSDSLRIYGEFIWADIYGEELPPAPPDIDRGDILDLFVDVKLGEIGGKSVYVRGGRQELLYGSQRLLTPLPWANRRHTFDGLKIFRHGEKWDLDAFLTKYVPPRANEFDSSDDNLTFGGVWATNKPKKGEFRDFYYLMYDNDRTIVTNGVERAPFQAHTLGSRWAGDQDGFLWDFEGALQFGEHGNNDLFAGMATAGVGRRFDTWLSPTFWMYYDYASGDDDLTDGNAHTFNPLFPFGHYYMGWMDLVSRQNIHDVNAHLYLYPTHWMTVWMQYHHFWLAESRDALYNAGGVPYRIDPTGAAGTNVGDELDLVINFHLNSYSDILLSYNKLFGGGFLEATSGPNRAVDADSLYLIYQRRW